MVLWKRSKHECRRVARKTYGEISYVVVYDLLFHLMRGLDVRVSVALPGYGTV